MTERIHIVYPIPFDAWGVFEPFVTRFTNTFKEFDPGHDYLIHAMCCWGAATDDVRRMFYGTKAMFHQYNEDGCDIGSAQYLARYALDGGLMIMMTSRCYFHKPGWLKRYAEVREEFGPGLYGASASWEGGKPHICTRAYMMDQADFFEYPHIIDTRPKGQKFETGEWCVTDWMRERDLPTMQITWDGAQEQDQWRVPENIFRKGDQSNMLVLDRHTQIYHESDAEGKLKLEEMVNPK